MLSLYLVAGLGYGVAIWLRDREALGRMSWKRNVNVVVASLIWPIDAITWADWVYKWGIRQAIYATYKTVKRWIGNLTP